MTWNQHCYQRLSVHNGTIMPVLKVVAVNPYIDWINMRVGIIGLGRVGLPIARFMHENGHEVFSWTRIERILPWKNSLDLAGTAREKLDILIIASGATRPNHGNEVDELNTTVELVSHGNFYTTTKIFYISSGAVYGECLTPKTEKEIPKPTTVYGKSKLRAEQRLDSVFGKQVSFLRVGNIVNADNPYGLLRQINNAAKSGSLELLGDPSDCRDYIGVADFLSCLACLISLEETPKILNIGSGNGITLDTLVQLIKSEVDEDLLITWKPRRAGDLSKTKLVTKLMTNKLGVYPLESSSLIRDYVRQLF